MAIDYVGIFTWETGRIDDSSILCIKAQGGSLGREWTPCPYITAMVSYGARASVGRH